MDDPSDFATFLSQLATFSASGYRIPEGAWLHTNVYAIHYDEKYWGDPHVFRPERFMKEGKFVGDKHLIPFGIGQYQGCSFSQKLSPR